MSNNILCKCGNCGKDVKTWDDNWRCTGCKAGLKKFFYGVTRTDSQAIALFQKKVLKNAVCKYDGKRTKPKDFKMDFDAKRVVPVVDPEQVIDYKCSCNGEIGVKGAIETCKSCGAFMWTVQYKVRLTKEQKRIIWSGGEAYIEGMEKPSDGSKFNAYLSLDKDTKKIEFRFGPSPTQIEEQSKKEKELKNAEIVKRLTAEQKASGKLIDISPEMMNDIHNTNKDIDEIFEGVLIDDNNPEDDEEEDEEEEVLEAAVAQPDSPVNTQAFNDGFLTS